MDSIYNVTVYYAQLYLPLFQSIISTTALCVNEILSPVSQYLLYNIFLISILLITDKYNIEDMENI